MLFYRTKNPISIYLLFAVALTSKKSVTALNDILDFIFKLGEMSMSIELFVTHKYCNKRRANFFKVAQKNE